ncbi:hypothetical protein SAMYPH_77 [Streptomyces phage Samy]|nr:hypothetical protein [Streptomyces ambofaciens]WNA15408.1 hypothetical protein SAMYPH_77 [Streptomyces phage Samy]
MPTFADSLDQFFNDLRDAGECEFWECPRTGAQPHDRNCLTGSSTDDDE